VLLGVFEVCHFTIVREGGEVSGLVFLGDKTVEKAASGFCFEDGEDIESVEWGADSTAKDAKHRGSGFCFGNVVVVLKGDVGFANDLIGDEEFSSGFFGEPFFESGYGFLVILFGITGEESDED